MKASLTFFILLFHSTLCYTQIKKTIYCFPGQGSDKRIFDSLTIDSSFTLQIIEYGTPEKGMSMKSFAQQLSTQIDTTNSYILLGVSLGGMICVELSELLNPEKTIIISSAKNRNELPDKYKIQKEIPIYKILPKGTFLIGAKILQPIVEPDRNKNKETFKKMLSSKNKTYMKRTVQIIINWERDNNSKKVYQIHGDNDHTIPIKNILTPDYIVQNGSHMMTLTDGKNVSEVLNEILKK